MTVSVLLPSTGRPEMVLQTLESIRMTADVEYVVAVDADKKTMREVLKFFRSNGIQDFKVSWSGDYRGCSKAWNDALELSTGDPIVLAADDLIFHEGWMEAALAKMKDLPKGGGLVGFNDTQVDGEGLATHYMMSRWFIDNCLGGVVAWEDYKHSFNDVEATLRAKQAERYIHAPDAVVEHRHWIFGTRPQDDTDRRFLGDHAASHANFQERAAAGFPD